MANKIFKKVFLIILDGFGLAPPSPGNAILNANMQYINSLLSSYPSYSLLASSLVVGLPSGKFGNSEVGHSALGTGRVVVQDWARINNDVKDGSFFENKALLDTIEHCKQNNSNLHITGCFSTGGVHSHQDHMFAIMELAKKQGFNRIFLHLITDGKDTSATASLESLAKLEPLLKDTGAQIASISGRAYGMDRVFNWPLTKQVWDVMVNSKGVTTYNPKEYLEESHKKGFTDNDVVPTVVTQQDRTPIASINDNDGIIFFDYRNDRMRQIVRPFVVSDFKEFDRVKNLQNLFITTMTRYSSELPVNAIAYESLQIDNALGVSVSNAGLKQVRIAEQEKKAHVTNFFNGGSLEVLPGSERIIVESKRLKVDELAQHPEMAAEKVVETVLQKAKENFSLYVVNFANADMVAHTGNLDATIKALKVLDASLKQVVGPILQDPESAIVLTCDHGNSEELIDPLTGGPDTQHSTNPVPVIFMGKGLEADNTGKTLETLSNEQPMGSLIDVAPSVLSLLGITKPSEMTGNSLI
ncbi:MAG: 2,3-bisphosphoglycerate-independent phosphoglycerate mutase [Parcubacteria group bacterium]